MGYEKRTLVDNKTIIDKKLLDHMQNGIADANYFALIPKVEMGALNTSGLFADSYYGKQYYRTAKFLKVATLEIAITIAEDSEIRVYEYDKDFAFLKYQDYTAFTGGTENSITVSEDCAFVRFCIRKDSSLTEFGLPVLKVAGVYGKEYFDVRPSNGYQRLIVPVNVAHPTASDAETWEVQDEEEILPDYGLLALPKTYCNTGKPTRLIIYCHGAGVNYASTVSTFPTSDLEPEYWLAEGYAVMDIEGNPFDNTNEHGYMPGARQAYMAAYEWIINTYNICRDGIFLGGRSMGGGMCFELLQSTIPILAACPVVPVCNQLWWWNYMSAARKSFCAEQMGFTGTAPTWSSSKTLTDDEKQYLYDNFDKMVKYSPLWRGIENLPDKDTLFAHSQIAATATSNDAEAEMYAGLRFKAKAPVKIFACYEDATVPYARNALYMYNMLKNAAQVCELRLFSTDASSPHHFEQQDSRAYIDATTIYGETVNAPLVYVEMMQFWRRYEKTI